jgi:hypothetical protein
MPYSRHHPKFLASPFCRPNSRINGFEVAVRHLWYRNKWNFYSLVILGALINRLRRATRWKRATTLRLAFRWYSAFANKSHPHISICCSIFQQIASLDSVALAICKVQAVNVPNSGALQHASFRFVLQPCPVRVASATSIWSSLVGNSVCPRLAWACRPGFCGFSDNVPTTSKVHKVADS